MRPQPLLLLHRFSRVRLCVTPVDGSPWGSSVLGILQARILEWVAIFFSNAWMHAKLLQSCPTLWDPMESSPPGSSVHRILQARILEWVAISFSSRWGLGWLYLPLEMNDISFLLQVTWAQTICDSFCWMSGLEKVWSWGVTVRVYWWVTLTLRR